MSRPPRGKRRRLRDEEVVAAVVRAVLDDGPVVGQDRLRDLVLDVLRARRRDAGLTAERARRLAARSGMVDVQVAVRLLGATPEIAKCLVCGSQLARTANQTLTGGRVPTGYKCNRCGWWTGAREYRVPARYTFTAGMEREGRQMRFRRKERRL